MDLEVHILNIPVIVPSVTSFQINYIKHVAQHSTSISNEKAKVKIVSERTHGFSSQCFHSIYVTCVSVYCLSALYAAM